MFGPALLVAPVTEQGCTARQVYLPAGSRLVQLLDERDAFTAARPITVAAPIDTLPLFVRAGSILPLGVPVESTNEKQTLQELRVYPGADAAFDLYNDDGTTYDYEAGSTQITHLAWSEATQKLTHTGAALLGPPDATLIKVIQPR